MKLTPLKTIVITVQLFLSINSCRSLDADNRFSEEGAVKINILGTEYSDTVDMIPLPPDKKALSSVQPNMQRNIVPINKELNLVSELITDTTNTEKEDLPSGSRYKITVYDARGTYVMERDYIRGQESEKDLTFNLSSDHDYTFIIYSIGSSAELPTITYNDPSNKTLRTGLLNVNDDVALTYARKDIKVDGKNTNHIDAVLKHKFSQIEVNFISGIMPIKDLKANLTPGYKTGNLQLYDGNIINNGTASQIPIEFNELNKTSIIGKKIVINSNTNKAVLTIPSITLGTETFNYDGPYLENLTIWPGMKYKLNVVISNDSYLNYMGQPVVRIDGMKWMRHNLGANTSINPNQDPSVKELHGNYYVFGRPTPIGNADSVQLPANAEPYDGDGKAWNSGTEENPIKTANDPCPNGFRIPTVTELQKLFDATTMSYSPAKYDWIESATNYAAAAVLTSKNSPHIKIVFPATGNLSKYKAASFNRGNNVFITTSDFTKKGYVTSSGYNESAFIDNRVDYMRSNGYIIRCIAE